MMSQKTTKTSLLDFFYEHVSEDDWLNGVDIYQAGKVAEVRGTDGLVTGRIVDMGSKNEVRMKIHPNGHQIQWLECTCSKNRAKGFYCEHMAAFMLHIDREATHLLGALDLKMPLKPPVGAKRVRPAAEPAASTSLQNSPQEILLQHLDSSIHSVSLLTKGPGLRVRVEIKQGQLSNYDLPLDAAAKFIQKKSNLAKATSEVKELEVFEEKAILGTRVYQDDNDALILERVIALPATKKKTIDKTDAIYYSEKVPKGVSARFEFYPFRANEKYLGQSYFFQPHRGYWPVSREELTTAWYEQPLSSKLVDDQVAELINQQFASIIANGPMWLDPKLKNANIQVQQLKEIRIRSSEDGWFTLDPRYGEGKASVSMVELMKAYKKKHQTYHKTKDGWMKIPELVKNFAWNLDESGEFLKVDTLGLMRLRAALGEFDQFAGSKKILDQIRNRIEFTDEAKVPRLKNSNLNLRNYQEVGLQWLWWLYQNGLHGLLADEMGLGKTHQAMALLTAIQSEKKDAKFLVICPTTVLDHWHDKMEKFCPNLKVIKHHGTKRGFTSNLLGVEFDTVLTSYGVLLRDVKQLSQVQWDVAILDEAHFVKNNETATYQAACRLNATMRLCLTGTPMENRVSELKNIFDFLVPGFLGSDDYFKRNFIQPLESNENIETEIALQKLIHPLKMRRTKSLVLDDLPEKIEDVRHTELAEEQVKLYRDVVELKARPLINQLENDESPIPYLHVFATLNLLKQICDHPCLVNGSADFRKHESGKFELLKGLLEEAHESQHKVVIYSQYLGMIRIIHEYLTEIGRNHVVLTGETRNRGEVIKSFQEDDSVRVFVGSLLAGGIGIDLTSASVVIHYDRWWNASKENQATDRVHRIGQTKNVQVLKLVTKGTLEEKIDAMIKAKQALFERFLDKDEELFKTLSRREIIDLLK